MPMRSHPSWVRGLKQAALMNAKAYTVAPLVGAWIETSAGTGYNDRKERRTPRGCVD